MTGGERVAALSAQRQGCTRGVRPAGKDEAARARRPTNRLSATTLRAGCLAPIPQGVGISAVGAAGAGMTTAVASTSGGYTLKGVGMDGCGRINFDQGNVIDTFVRT